MTTAQHTERALKLPDVFHQAGLPSPALRVDTLVGTGPDAAVYRLATHTVRSLLPLIERLGVATSHSTAAAAQRMPSSTHSIPSTAPTGTR